jgi:hypothetical protein
VKSAYSSHYDEASSGVSSGPNGCVATPFFSESSG